mgnify:CR=1 FL=1
MRISLPAAGMKGKGDKYECGNDSDWIRGSAFFCRSYSVDFVFCFRGKEKTANGMADA